MRVLFNKTSFKTSFEPGIIAAATAKKNAELGSAGTRKFSGFSGMVRGAGELRVKECDRIKFMVEGLRKFGIKARELEDGFEITGKSELNFSACAQAQNPAHENLSDSFKANLDEIKTSGDHRIAMSFLILGLKFGANVENAECYRTSFPNFGEILASLGAKFEN